jgi:hypothetical protein
MTVSDPGAGAAARLPEFSPLSDGARAELADLRNFVSRLVSSRTPGRSLFQTAADFELLQKLVEDEDVACANEGTWIGIGLAFGDALAAFIPGLNWCMVTDEHGTCAVLRYMDTTLYVNALYMPLRRVERRESFDLGFMAHELKSYVDERARDALRPS